MKPTQHRVTADSRAGKRMAQAKGARIVSPGEDGPHAQHNRAIEEKRQAKLRAKRWLAFTKKP